MLLLPVYTRYLDPEQYGILGAVAAIGGILTVLMEFGLTGAIIRYYFDYNKNELDLRGYISSVVYFLIVLNGIFTVILFTAGRVLFSWLFGAEEIRFFPYIALVLGACYARTLSFVPLALYRAQQRALKYAVVQFLQVIVSAGITLYFLMYSRMGAEAKLWGDFLGQSAVSILLLVLIGPQCLAVRFEWDKLAGSLGYGLPLMVHSLAGWVLALSDRLILQRYRPLEEVGLYTLGYSLGLVMDVLVKGINHAYTPFFYETMENNPSGSESFFKRFGSLYVLAVGAACLTGMLFAKELIFLILPKSYWGSYYITPIILLGYFYHGLYFLSVNHLMYHKRTRIIPLLTFATAIFNVVLNFMFIPKYGAVGAAWTTLISCTARFLVVFLVARDAFGISYEMVQFWAVALGMSLAGICVYTMELTTRLTVFGCFLLVTIFVNRENILSFWNIFSLKHTETEPQIIST